MKKQFPFDIPCDEAKIQDKNGGLFYLLLQSTK